VLAAAQFWSGKDPAQWTANDISRLLNDSPWAQQASASFGSSTDAPDMPAAPLPGPAQAGMAGRNGVSDGRWDGGVSKNVGVGVPSLPVMVRWDSALPIREALLKSQPQQDVVDQAQKDYILTVIGLVPAGRYRASSGHLATHSESDETLDSTGRASQDPEEMLEGLMAASALIPRDRPPIRPEDVKLDASTGAIHLFFPRTQPITLKDKEVTFTTHFGSMTISKSFRLKEMAYRKKLEL